MQRRRAHRSPVLYRGWVAHQLPFCAGGAALRIAGIRGGTFDSIGAALTLRPAYRVGVPSRASELPIPQRFADEDHDRAGERHVVPNAVRSARLSPASMLLTRGCARRRRRMRQVGRTRKGGDPWSSSLVSRLPCRPEGPRAVSFSPRDVYSCRPETRERDLSCPHPRPCP